MKIEERLSAPYRMIEDEGLTVAYEFYVIPTQGRYASQELQIEVGFSQEQWTPKSILLPFSDMPKPPYSDVNSAQVAINKESAEWIDLLKEVSSSPDQEFFNLFNIEFAVRIPGHGLSYAMANLEDMAATMTIMNTVQDIVADFLSNHESDLMALKFTARVDDKGRVHAYKRLTSLLANHLGWVGMAELGVSQHKYVYIVWDPEILSNYAEV